MDTVLVTGGGGFIGSNFVLEMADHYKLVVLDSCTYAASFDYIKNVKYKMELGDIRNLRHLREILKKHKPKYIVHFAAESHVDNSIDGPLVFVETNVVGTACLLEAIRTECPTSRLVHVSTDEVYGSIDEGSFTELSPLDPSSPYSSTKAASDLIALSYHKTYGLDIVVTNSSNNYGPNQNREKLIPKVISNALSMEPIPIYGDGSNVRDWIHVKDNVEAIKTVMEHGRSGERYNIGGESCINNLNLALTICSLIDSIKGVFGSPRSSFIKFVTDRPAHDKRYSINCDKVKRLGWRPKIDIDAGLRSTVSWYMESHNTEIKKAKHSELEPLLLNSLQSLLQLNSKKFTRLV